MHMLVPAKESKQTLKDFCVCVWVGVGAEDFHPNFTTT